MARGKWALNFQTTFLQRETVERQSEVLGSLCIGLDSIANTGSFTKMLRAKDKRPRKKRECSWCKLHNNRSYECKERGGSNYCDHKNSNTMI